MFKAGVSTPPRPANSPGAHFGAAWVTISSWLQPTFKLLRRFTSPGSDENATCGSATAEAILPGPPTRPQVVMYTNALATQIARNASRELNRMLQPSYYAPDFRYCRICDQRSNVLRGLESTRTWTEDWKNMGRPSSNRKCQTNVGKGSPGADSTERAAGKST